MSDTSSSVFPLHTHHVSLLPRWSLHQKECESLNKKKKRETVRKGETTLSDPFPFDASAQFSRWRRDAMHYMIDTRCALILDFTDKWWNWVSSITDMHFDRLIIWSLFTPLFAVLSLQTKFSLYIVSKICRIVLTVLPLSRSILPFYVMNERDIELSSIGARKNYTQIRCDTLCNKNTETKKKQRARANKRWSFFVRSSVISRCVFRAFDAPSRNERNYRYGNYARSAYKQSHGGSATIIALQVNTLADYRVCLLLNYIYAPCCLSDKSLRSDTTRVLPWD